MARYSTQELLEIAERKRLDEAKRPMRGTSIIENIKGQKAESLPAYVVINSRRVPLTKVWGDYTTKKPQLIFEV